MLEALVGVAWQFGFARAARVELAWQHGTLLFACLWLVYASDRWMDARASSVGLGTARHRFFARHSRLLAGSWTCVLAASVGLASVVLRLSEWFSSLLVLTLALGYLWFVHSKRARGLTKETLVALIYAAGVGVFVWPHAVLTPALVLAQLLFAALVLLNLAAIASFERSVDFRHGFESLATRHRAVESRATWASVALAWASALSASFVDAEERELFVGIALCALVTLWLLRVGRRLEPDVAHGLADLALLLPLTLWML